MDRLIRRLHLNRGIFIVAAAGNENRYKEYDFPAAYAGVMAVAGTEKDGTGRYVTSRGGSNWGPYVDIAAPGESIWGARRGSRNKYTAENGTSSATPHVAAAGALLAAKGARSPQIKRAIIRTANDRGTPGRDNKFGHGLVDFDGSVNYYLKRK